MGHTQACKCRPGGSYDKRLLALENRLRSVEAEVVETTCGSKYLATQVADVDWKIQKVGYSCLHPQ